MAQEPRHPKKSAPSRGKDRPAPSSPLVENPEGAGRFQLRGACELHASTLALQPHPAVKLSPKAQFSPGAARAYLRTETVEVQPDDLVEVEFSDGGVLWMRGDDYRSLLGTAAARSRGEADIAEVLPTLQLLPEGFHARGPISWAVKSLKIFGVDLEAKTAEGIAGLIDGRTLVPEHHRNKRPVPGLYRCHLATNQFSLEPAELKDTSDQPLYLLFIHGVASSTWGSFGDLWSAERRAELDALRRAYGGHALAFEHATLTRSPIENALRLASDLETLSEGARLHLVTQSSGGLIGELLCRAGALKSSQAGGAAAEVPLTPPAFSPEEHQLLERGRQTPAGQAELLRQLDGALSRLARKNIKVERLVRVACPALGTTLASGRLDRWLSVFGNMAGAALPDSPLADMLKDIGTFIAAVVKQRTDPATLPGLEAMMPDSAFMRIINWPAVSVAGDLAVIAGDIDPDAWWTRLLVWVTDRFYDGDHDLVVNTPSMYGGAKRLGRSMVSFHKGPEVNHFRYFQNPDSARRLVQALTAPAGDAPEGFEALRKPTVDIARAVVPRSAEPRPVVFVLPGIMGSELAVDGDRVWLDIPDIIFGGFGQIRIEAGNVVALRPFARYYGELIDYLAQTHKVVPFAFDWRIALEKEADRLAAAVRRELDALRGQRQPVRILGHSLGGLVARAMIARHEALWTEMCATPGARLVMLGTPNGGSHAITELLVAQSSILRKLARFDITRSPRDLLEIVARFPGVLSILPKDSREDYFSLSTWEAYHAKAGHGWILPAAKDLERAREFRRLLDGAPIDPAHMLYVAGCADVTAAGMHLDPHDHRIRFEATARGDGRVTWESGIPAGVPAWYMEDVEHGDLTAHPDGFEAIEELLRAGTTSRLPQSPPVSRAAEVLFPMPPPAEELFPDEDGLVGDVLGAGPRKHRRTTRRERPVQVRVAHGNLAYARYPVAVGHYAGDTIISAEKHLDLSLASALTRRHQIGLYPGEIGTNAVFINPKLAANPAASPRGAVVVGLGTVGSLNAAALTRSIRRALLEYAVQWKDFGPKLLAGPSGDMGEELGVSALLIGTGAGGIPVDDSVFALLQAVSGANKALASAKSAQRIRQVEFIELYEDRAIQAVEALRRIASQAPLRDSFGFEDGLDARKGGLSRVSYDEPGGWWQRLQVLGGTKPGAPIDGSLRFSASTRRARSEVRLLATQRALLDQFIQQSIQTTRDNRAAARTLFELLLPNEIKDQAPDQDDTVLIVDEPAARYPWELLDDRFSRGDRDQPLFVAHGLLRQLESFEFREGVRGVIDNTALVIGDPLSQFPELKGAQAEARAVHRAFQSDGRFRCEMRERPNSQQVINALYAADYKVLHLAGHGVYRMPPEEASHCAACHQPLPRETAARLKESVEPLTGMVIGDGVVLSPQEVHQMRCVPELVFINCCHLGNIETGDPRTPKERNVRDDYNRIAANVATEFIRMGVRAVVAAGWAVDDSAALTFATAFYDQMLKGRPFGEAIKASRKEVFERHPGTNTWGAYQCYGDPDYRLIKVEGTEKDDPELKWVSPSQVVAEINNITARLATRAGQSASFEKRQLKAIAAWLKKRPWQNDGKVWAALGRGFGEAGRYGKAIACYKRALLAENAQATLKDIEQLANFESRHAVRLAGRAEPQAALATIDQAIGRLNAICDQRLMEEPEKDQTVERLSLLGSAFKRKALVSTAERAASLKQMRTYYEQAGALALKRRNRVDPYPLLNRLTAELTMAWQEGKRGIGRKARQAFTQGLSDSRLELESAQAKAPEVWGRISLCDLDLLAALAEAKFDEETAGRIAEAYRDARKLASPREFESVFDQFDFLKIMGGERPDVLKFLDSIRKQIEGSRPGSG